MRSDSSNSSKNRYVYPENGSNAPGSPYHRSPFFLTTQITHIEEALPWTPYPHTHENEYEISYMIDGSGILNLPGTQIPMNRNSLIIIPPQTAHFYTAGGESNKMDHYSLRFRASGDASGLQKELELHGCCSVRSADPDAMHRIKIILDLILDHSDAADHDDCRQVLAHSVLMMTNRLLRTGGENIPVRLPVYANDILRYLQNHIYSKVTMEEVAEHFNLSQSHIFRIFTNTYHISPINYLIYCRMREARHYILKEHLTAAEIAPRLAYRSTYHFVKTFTKFYGCHPDEYLTHAPEFQ